MSIYLEKAKELGNLILTSEQAIMLADATSDFKNSEDAVKKMEEYNNYQEDVKKSMSDGNLSKEEITVLTRRLTEMATDLKQEPHVAALVFAENEFNAFVNKVMGVVKSTIMGENEEESCEGCQGCNGSCH